MFGLFFFGFHAVSMIFAFKDSAVFRSFRDDSVEFRYICGSSPLFFPEFCINVDFFLSRPVQQQVHTRFSFAVFFEITMIL